MFIGYVREKAKFNVKKLNEHKIDFGYYCHPPYELPPYSGSQHLIKIFLSSGVIERSLGEQIQQERVRKVVEFYRPYEICFQN